MVNDEGSFRVKLGVVRRLAVRRVVGRWGAVVGVGVAVWVGVWWVGR